MGLKARSLAEKFYDREKIIEKLESILDNIIDT